MGSALVYHCCSLAVVHMFQGVLLAGYRAQITEHTGGASAASDDDADRSNSDTECDLHDQPGCGRTFI